ncbi:MAG: hypothetical protein R3F14_14320 [Polyangiaceae bacterium]
MGVSAAVDVKFLRPVFAGQKLVYTVTQTHAVENILRFEVQAEVEGHVVARGVMSGAMGTSLPGARSTLRAGEASGGGDGACEAGAESSLPQARCGRHPARVERVFSRGCLPWQDSRSRS